ncbi:putative glycolipid-binding domain-containing protein [Paracoccus benzoatiresistens]|uniref:Glycolipid-binding domain-containing protein n=1 Tax=Paracoccus benzoatiresistens TaxID=2997341 RepID=A0ABT4J8G0_9RHOB|nr:putative glycolipid-binding domain-containing protein [Paracoccus sp. EF6]MCZ0963376.1 putative glycolipid-binding domain-containing protein [Paracoccus sp. EF6]
MVVSKTVFWRRLDTDGLERLSVVENEHGLRIDGTILTTEDGGCRVDHRWQLDPGWRVLDVAITRAGSDGDKTLRLWRTRDRWMVNGQPRPDLDGALEVDLSLTPFCNTLALRRLMAAGDGTLVLDVAYVDGATLDVLRSRQGYDRIADGLYRYRDLGIAPGFEAMLDVDESGFVVQYEGLFARAG